MGVWWDREGNALERAGWPTVKPFRAHDGFKFLFCHYVYLYNFSMPRQAFSAGDLHTYLRRRYLPTYIGLTLNVEGQAQV